MCDFEADDQGRMRIDQGLYEAVRRIERRLAGRPAADAAWDVFFGRTGGAVMWSDYQRIRSCYAKAELGARLSTPARSSAFLCGAADTDLAGGRVARA
jgi:hypothetical protein